MIRKESNASNKKQETQQKQQVQQRVKKKGCGCNKRKQQH